MRGRNPEGHTSIRLPPPSYLAVALQLAGAGLILVGTFTPWVRTHVFFLAIPVNGIKTDYGRLFPFLALAVCAILASQWSFGWRKWLAGPVLIIGVVAIAVAVVYGVQVKGRAGRADEAARKQSQAPLVVLGGTAVSVDLDVGYFLTLLGAVSLLVGSTVTLTRKQ